MMQKFLNRVLPAVCFAALAATGQAGQAAPNGTAVCVRDAIAQYNDSKAAALVCLDQLEADIAEGIAVGLPLSPVTIQLRTDACLTLEMTPEQRKAAIAACQRGHAQHGQKNGHGHGDRPGDKVGPRPGDNLDRPGKSR